MRRMCTIAALTGRMFYQDKYLQIVQIYLFGDVFSGAR